MKEMYIYVKNAQQNHVDMVSLWKKCGKICDLPKTGKRYNSMQITVTKNGASRKPCIITSFWNPQLIAAWFMM